MILDACSIVQRWSALLAGRAEDGPGMFALIEETLEAVKVPGLSWWQESISAGLLTELLGKRQDALLIRFKPAPEWPVALLAEPFGEDLHVSWLLIVTPRRLRDLQRLLRLGRERSRWSEIGSELDPLDRLKFDAVLQLTRRAVRLAIEQLGAAEELQPDFDRFDEAPIE